MVDAAVTLTPAEFLLERIQDDERDANMAMSTVPADEGWYRVAQAAIADPDFVVRYGVAYPHIARWDPARVLAECEAKRRIIELHTSPPDTRTEAEMHRARAHPAWEYDTTTGPRKAWGNPDVPPDSSGWVPNVDAGRDGWERFDYHEESYWRRPRVEPLPRRESLTLRLLAQPYAGHPDYRPEWKP